MQIKYKTYVRNFDRNILKQENNRYIIINYN